MGIDKKAKLIESANKRLLEGNKQHIPDLPPNHRVALRVPKGGSCCANCKFWDLKNGHCDSEYYIKWNGDKSIPYPADEFCSDFWEPKDGSK